MAIDWHEIKRAYDALNQELLHPSLEVSRRHKVQKKVAHVGALIAQYDELESLKKELGRTQEQAAQNSDPELAVLFQEEVQMLTQRIATVERELNNLLFPPDERDNSSVFIEIRAGTGGQEAALFAADLLRMYSAYALKKGWRVSLVSESFTDLKGYKEVVAHIEGKGVYGHLKFESGVHRVQRVPATETSGRVHTSTATVAVLPEVEDVVVSINPQDLRVDTYRAGGAGGQHVNKTDSAVRITHIPTGIVVACQDERSQHKNRNKAMKVLQARLYEQQREKQEQEMRAERKEQIGRGMRAEKVRTYNYPQNRVTDHQINLTLNKLDMVVEGALDEIIDALKTREQEERTQQSFSVTID